jgi:hypothetical protein
MEEIISELESELHGCDISQIGDDIEVYLETPLEEYYNEAVDIANDIMNETDMSFTIDGDYEGHFTIEIYG